MRSYMIYTVGQGTCRMNGSLPSSRQTEVVFHVRSKDFVVFLLSDRVNLLSPFG